MHEPIESHTSVEGGSDRAFGLTIAAVLTLIGAVSALFGTGLLWGLLPAAAVLAALALVSPRALAPLNRLWFRLGLLLHRIVNPVVLGIIFFGVMLPTALCMRLVGRDPLRRRVEPGADSYWIPRDPPGPDAQGMKEQF